MSKTPTRRRSLARSPGDARLPWQLLVPALLGLGLVLIPVVGLLARTPWTHLPRLLASSTTQQAAGLSLVTASLSTVISLLLGVPLAWVLSRTQGRMAALLRAVVTLPMVLPPVVGGVALLAGLGRAGLIGSPIARATGISLPFTTAAVVVAETFVAMPFLIVSVEGALRGADAGQSEAAATLGASPLAIFWRVTLPQLAPVVAAGSLLCWARALGEFGATITFAGNLAGTTQTLPLAVYQLMELDPDSALALSVVLLAISVAVLTTLRSRWLIGLSGGWP